MPENAKKIVTVSVKVYFTEMFEKLTPNVQGSVSPQYVVHIVVPSI